MYGEMFKSLDDLTDEREHRVGVATLKLHSGFWLVTCLLGLILVALSTAIQAAGYHTVSIAAQGLALALLAALLFCSDRPFNGAISISPALFINVLVLINARS